jgi:hypothetical protein
LREETGAAAHEDLRPTGKQRFAAEECGNEGRCRRKQENSPPSKGKPDQQTKRGQNPQEAHFSALGQEHIEIDSGAFLRLDCSISDFEKGGIHPHSSHHRRRRQQSHSPSPNGNNPTISAADLNPVNVTAPSPGIDEYSPLAAAGTHIAKAAPFDDPPALTTGDATFSNVDIDIDLCLGGRHARWCSQQPS